MKVQEKIYSLAETYGIQAEVHVMYGDPQRPKVVIDMQLGFDRLILEYEYCDDDDTIFLMDQMVVFLMNLEG